MKYLMLILELIMIGYCAYHFTVTLEVAYFGMMWMWIMIFIADDLF